MAFKRPASTFELRQRRDGGRLELRLGGELDVANARELSRVVRSLRTTGVERIVLDLRGVEFIDSPGIGCVLELWSLARRTRCALTVLDAPGQVRDALRRSGIARALEERAGEGD